MPGFHESFWSPDYTSGKPISPAGVEYNSTDDIRPGLTVLFDKLQQGVTENKQVLTIARLRAEAEEAYGLNLAEIGVTADKIPGGFSRDDGASVRKVWCLHYFSWNLF
jgi:hypothetical protein